MSLFDLWLRYWFWAAGLTTALYARSWWRGFFLGLRLREKRKAGLITVNAVRRYMPQETKPVAETAPASADHRATA